MKDLAHSPDIVFISHEITFNLADSLSTSAWLKQTIITEQKNLDIISIIFCSDQYLLTLNKKHLNHDYYTDIITFPYGTDPLNGELYISVDRVKENALKFDIPLNHELHRVMVHGVLHLLGYTDRSKEENKTMRAKEDHYLCILFDKQKNK